MRRHRVMLLLFGMLIMSLWGCAVIHHYEFEGIEFPVLGGEFVLIVNGRYGEPYVKDGTKMVDRTFPYYLQFTFRTRVEYKLHQLVIKDIELVGEDSGRRIRLEDIQTDEVRVYEQTNNEPAIKQARETAGPLTADGYGYENYTLRATIIIYRDETHYESEELTVQLVTKYLKEYTNATFDTFMDSF